MVWKRVNNVDAGSLQVVGGNDWDKLMGYFNGDPEVDIIDINTTTSFRDAKFQLRDTSSSYFYRFRTSALTGTIDITVPSSSLPDALLMANTTQTLKNKTIDARLNTVNYVKKFPSVKKSGDILCISTTETGYGLLAGYTKIVTPTFQNANTGSYLKYSTGATANTSAGIKMPAVYMRRDWNPRLRCRYATSLATAATRFYFGFSSLVTLTATDTPLATTDVGFIIGFRSTDTFLQIFCSDGTGGTTGTFATSTAVDTNIHTIEIRFDDVNSIVYYSIDGATETGITIDIPPAATLMTVHCLIQNTTTTSKDLDLRYVELETSV